MAGNKDSLVALTAKGEAYVWGDGAIEILEGQNVIIEDNKPTLVPNLSDYFIIKASISEHHLLVIGQNKKTKDEVKVFGFGNNDNYPLGDTTQSGKYVLPIPEFGLPYLISAGNYCSIVFYKSTNFFVNADAKCEITNESPIEGSLFALNTSNGTKFYSSNARHNPAFPPLTMAFTHPIQSAKTFKFPSFENCKLIPLEVNIECAKCKTQIKGPQFIPCISQATQGIICERCFLNKIYGPTIGVYYRINQDHLRPSIALPLYKLEDFYQVLDDTVKIEQTIRPNCRYILHPHFTGDTKDEYANFLKSMAKFQEKHDLAIIDLLNIYTRENDIRFSPRNRIELRIVKIFFFKKIGRQRCA